MRRREFIARLVTLGAVTLTFPASAQQPDRKRRIGVLMLYDENDSAGQVRASAFRKGLEKLGWTTGLNLEIDYHWGVGDMGWIYSAVAQLLQRSPDVILAKGGPAARVVQQATSTVPVIFIAGADPVADGLVQSLAHPGGNLTGFAVLEASVETKLLQLLKEIAPNVSSVTVVMNPDNPGNRRLADEASAAAPRFGIKVNPAPVSDNAEIESVMAKLGRGPDYGLVVLPDPSTRVRTH